MPSGSAASGSDRKRHKMQSLPHKNHKNFPVCTALLHHRNMPFYGKTEEASPPSTYTPAAKSEAFFSCSSHSRPRSAPEDTETAYSPLKYRSNARLPSLFPEEADSGSHNCAVHRLQIHQRLPERSLQPFRKKCAHENSGPSSF